MGKAYKHEYEELKILGSNPSFPAFFLNWKNPQIKPVEWLVA